MTTKQTNQQASLTPAQIARKLFVASQIATINASGHPLKARWVNAVIRAGEAFVEGKTARQDFIAKCETYNTSIAKCECEAGKRDGTPCKHRAFLRLVEKWATE
jgi:hypothetical protein